MSDLPDDREEWVPIEAEALKRVYDKLVYECGTDVWFESCPVCVSLNGGLIRSVTVITPAGRVEISAKCFIDCTGNADLCRLSGASVVRPEMVQPASLCFYLGGLDIQAFKREPELHSSNPDSPLHKIAADPRYPLITSPHFCIKILCGNVAAINAGYLYGVDISDPGAMFRLMRTGREAAAQYAAALAEYTEAFRNCSLIATAPLLGIRESVRINAVYNLTIDDYVRRARFDDAGALLLAKTARLNGDARLCAVTSCTTMDGAGECIAGIFADYGVTVPIGINTGEPFMCDGDYNRYAAAVKRHFTISAQTSESIDLLKRTLASGGRYTVAAIGPQRNIVGLVGTGLLEKAVDEVVIMGGTVADPRIKFENKLIDIEWNIEQDVSSAARFADKCLVDITYVPFEVGYDILTGAAIPQGTVARFVYDLRGSNGVRASWDPCAVYYAIYGTDDLFELSPYGRMKFDERGGSEFIEGEGRHRVLIQKASSVRIARRLDEFMH